MLSSYFMPSKTNVCRSSMSYPLKIGARGSLFLALLWIAFLLPNIHWTAFPFIIGHTNLSELALILMPFVYALYPRQRAVWYTKKLQYAILGFFLFSILNNLFQMAIYGGTITEFFRVHRSLIPLYIAMAIIYLGPRVRPKLLLANLAACLSISFTISIVFFFFDLDFHPLFHAEIDEEAYEILLDGRLYNINAGFSYLALGLMVVILFFRQKLKPKKLVWLLLLACTLSIFTTVLTFNRTSLVIFALFFVLVVPFFFRLRVVFYMMIIFLVIILMGIYSYKHFDFVQRQVDSRITIPLREGVILESVYYGKREYMYESYLSLGKKYFLIGVPPQMPWFTVFRKDRFLQVRTSDISFVTVLLRNGLLPLLFYFCIGGLLYRGLWKMRIQITDGWSLSLTRSLIITIPIMLIVSFNIDILSRHYSVLLLAFLFVAIPYKQNFLRK